MIERASILALHDRSPCYSFVVVDVVVIEEAFSELVNGQIFSVVAEIFFIDRREPKCSPIFVYALIKMGQFACISNGYIFVCLFLFSLSSSLTVESWCLRRQVKGKMSHNLETRSFVDEIRHFDKSSFFDFGHPLLNRIAESFVKAAGIGAIQAVSREAYFTAIEGAGLESSGGLPAEISVDGKKRHHLPDLRGRRPVLSDLEVLNVATKFTLLDTGIGETNRKSLEALVRNTGKESLQWGLAAGVYSGLTYGLRESRGVHDWKNSAVAGAITGVALALTADDKSHEQIVQCAITGAAISTAANLLAGIF
ncbi:hypothetical protein NC653_025493 [Populus alba x Populus x berolinensis]|uniref:Outer envelope pore protein 16-2, chloroplastic n=1 Tax=Populus alba x Populus x berolinensis TaxID=444605 RepID=A0AAD6Q7T8_9ROSI|nr:hypothetical protein NC653_025493 [Populus alba x Populus x berolinensis]